MLAYVVDESVTYQCNDIIENVVFECSSDYLILGQELVIVPLNSLSSSRGVVDYVCAVKLVESGRCHCVQIVLQSG